MRQMEDQNYYNAQSFRFPTRLKKLSHTDYLIAIDENGLPSMSHKSLSNPNSRQFTITAIKFRPDTLDEILQDVMRIKEKYWEKGLYNNRRVVFHSRDIRKKQGAFSINVIENYSLFQTDINELIAKLPITIYSSSIDKYKLSEQYYQPYPPYEIGIEFLLERVCMSLRNGEKITLLFESRNTSDDLRVLNKINNLRLFGNKYQDSTFFSPINGIFFNPKLTDDSMKSYFPLEIADLISYRIHRHVLNDSFILKFQSIEDKLDSYPDYFGKGLKIFPIDSNSKF